MPKIMNLPKLGVNMTDAIITGWLVNEGDTVKEGDHILDAETDKASQEIYATESGIITKILVQTGETALCQEPIALLAEPGEKLDESFDIKAQDTGKKEDVRPVTDKTDGKPTVVNVVSHDSRVRISPLAKKVAKDMKIDFKQVPPSVSGGRIIKADVLAFAEGMKSNISKLTQVKITSYGGGNEILEIIPLIGARKVIAERMNESNLTKPCAALTLHADAGKLVKWRDKLRKNGKAVSYNDLLVYIAAGALREYPIINSIMADKEIRLLKDINIGVAVDSEKGLMVPVIHNANKKGVIEISEELRSKIDRVKSGKGSVDDLTGGTFTITNLGMFEIEQFAPVINPPECCILAVGAVIREPVVVDDSDRIEVRSRIQLTLVFDHRIVDGAPAARFLQRIKHLIEWPMDLMS